jgi:two-component system NarL family sensor kinase
VAVLPMLIALPLSYGLHFAPRGVLVPSLAAGALITAATPAGTAFAIAYLWGTGVGFILGSGALVMARALERSAVARASLLVRALAREDAERRRLAVELHDDVLQLMLTARQDLEEAADGDPAALTHALDGLGDAQLALARAISALDIEEDAAAISGGLRAALQDAAARAERRGAGHVSVDVDERAAGVADSLLVRVARELLTNVAKHSQADAVSVRAVRDERGVRLDVIDDGVGFDRPRLAIAPESGHIGLAAATERVRAAGGDLALLDADGGGAHVRVTLPRQ